MCVYNYTFDLGASSHIFVVRTDNNQQRITQSPQPQRTPKITEITREEHTITKTHDLTRFGLNAYVLGAINGEIIILRRITTC